MSMNISFRETSVGADDVMVMFLQCFGCDDDVLLVQSTARSERAAAESRYSSSWKVASRGSPLVTTATPAIFVQVVAHLQRARAKTHWSQQRFARKAFDGTSGLSHPMKAIFFGLDFVGRASLASLPISSAIVEEALVINFVLTSALEDGHLKIAIESDRLDIIRFNNNPSVPTDLEL
ncbi:hypothetical protein NE237_004874 [Protea cynaroides]|uniref:Uncharacterized protein n=1 Tax=Protea cynaroides TaxID=273540 RepID=A0A9Q0QU04_9MAGN|nr:hypothetical protein NE237_004874 [Protea cynaroides]